MKLNRKLHRYFGLIIGIQFLFWTLGGIFFTWSNIEQIRGNTNRKAEIHFTDMLEWKSPHDVFILLSEIDPIDSILSFQSIRILELPYYQVKYASSGQEKTILVNALNLQVKPPLTSDEAVDLAKHSFTPESEVKKVELLTTTSVNKHHEYRNQPLPAYAITFDHRSGTRVYVSCDLGQVMKFRNHNWRIFDFFWMMHTMDYSGRDNFGNIVIRLFSILGIVTILSGFTLYFKTVRFSKKDLK